MPLVDFFKKRSDSSKSSLESQSLCDDTLVCNSFIHEWRKLTNDNTCVPSYASDKAQNFEDGIRLVILRESGPHRNKDTASLNFQGSGRRLVFDSKTLVDEENQVDINGQQFKLRSKPANDIKLLGEMIFGTVAIAQLVDCLKVHYIRFPPQLVLSRVFSPSALGRDASQSDLSNGGLRRSASALSLVQRLEDSLERVAAVQRHSLMKSQPERSISALSAGVNIPGGLRHSCTTQSPSVPFSGISLTPSSESSSQGMFLNSVHMRIVKSQLCAMSNFVDDDVETNVNSEERRSQQLITARLGVSLILAPFSEEDVVNNEKLRHFVFAHMALLEPLMLALCADIVQTLTDTVASEAVFGRFVALLGTLRSRLARLYLTPRLDNPVWLHLNSHEVTGANRAVLEHCFVEHCLLPVASRFAGSNRQYFAGALITALLTHHLSWLSSMSSSAAADGKTSTDEQGYNPSWAQLTDLYGLFGFPRKLARTLVLGQDRGIVHFFILFCSYFLRFNDVIVRDAQLPVRQIMKYNIVEWLSKKDVPTTEVEKEKSDDVSLSLPICEADVHEETLLNCSLGRSMLAAPSSMGYAPFFALQGVLRKSSSPSSPTSPSTTNDRVVDYKDDVLESLIDSDLRQALSVELLDERLAEAAVILVDVDQWKVSVRRLALGTGSKSKPSCVTVQPAACVNRLLDELVSLKNVPSALVLDWLEGRMREWHCRSVALGEQLSGARSVGMAPVRPQEIATLLGADISDASLLLAAASTHMGKFFPLGIL